MSEFRRFRAWALRVLAFRDLGWTVMCLKLLQRRTPWLNTTFHTREKPEQGRYRLQRPSLHSKPHENFS